MAINPNEISINVDGIDTVFDFADMWKELAEELQEFRNLNRASLSDRVSADLLDTLPEGRKRILGSSPKQKDFLREVANYILDEQQKLRERAAIISLEDLESQLEPIKDATKKIDQLVTDINNAEQIITEVSRVVGFIANVALLLI